MNGKRVKSLRKEFVLTHGREPRLSRFVRIEKVGSLGKVHKITFSEWRQVKRAFRDRRAA